MSVRVFRQSPCLRHGISSTISNRRKEFVRDTPKKRAIARSDPDFAERGAKPFRRRGLNLSKRGDSIEETIPQSSDGHLSIASRRAAAIFAIGSIGPVSPTFHGRQRAINLGHPGGGGFHAKAWDALDAPVNPHSWRSIASHRVGGFSVLPSRFMLTGRRLAGDRKADRPTPIVPMPLNSTPLIGTPLPLREGCRWPRDRAFAAKRLSQGG